MIASTGLNGARKVICIDMATPVHVTDTEDPTADMHLLAMEDAVAQLTSAIHMQANEPSPDMDGKMSDWAKDVADRARKAFERLKNGGKKPEPKDAAHKAAEPCTHTSHEIQVSIPKGYLDKMDKIFTTLTELLVIVVANTQPRPTHPIPSTPDEKTPTPDDGDTRPTGPEEGAPLFYVIHRDSA